MPPKNKKEQEEEAKRLQEEQKRRQEEQARLALERKKYASQTIVTGLVLPASNQIFLDLPLQPVAFISEKLQESILTVYPQLSEHKNVLKLLIKQLVYYSIDSLSLFKIENITEVLKNEEQLLKARVLVGIAFRLMINQHPAIGGKGKSKVADEKLLKEIVSQHVQTKQGCIKLYSLQDIQQVLSIMRRGYFNHFILLFNFEKFKKREEVERSYFYTSTATVFSNHKEIPFLDLSQKQKQEQSKPIEN